MTEALAGVDVADVHFHRRDFHRDQRIVQRDRGVRIAAGVDDDAGHLLGMRLVDEVDQFAFAVGLAAIGLQAELRRGLRAQFFDIGERRMAIRLRLPDPQQIEVRAVEDIDRRGRGLGASWAIRIPAKRGGAGRGVIGNNAAKGKPSGLPECRPNASSSS